MHNMILPDTYYTAVAAPSSETRSPSVCVEHGGYQGGTVRCIMTIVEGTIGRRKRQHQILLAVLLKFGAIMGEGIKHLSQQAYFGIYHITEIPPQLLRHHRVQELAK